jgi:hypothetical protein
MTSSVSQERPAQSKTQTIAELKGTDWFHLPQAASELFERVQAGEESRMCILFRKPDEVSFWGPRLDFIIQFGREFGTPPKTNYNAGFVISITQKQVDTTAGSESPRSAYNHSILISRQAHAYTFETLPERLEPTTYISEIIPAVDDIPQWEKPLKTLQTELAMFQWKFLKDLEERQTLDLFPKLIQKLKITSALESFVNIAIEKEASLQSQSTVAPNQKSRQEDLLRTDHRTDDGKGGSPF